MSMWHHYSPWMRWHLSRLVHTAVEDMRATQVWGELKRAHQVGKVISKEMRRREKMYCFPLDQCYFWRYKKIKHKLHLWHTLHSAVRLHCSLLSDLLSVQKSSALLVATCLDRSWMHSDLTLCSAVYPQERHPQQQSDSNANTVSQWVVLWTQKRVCTCVISQQIDTRPWFALVCLVQLVI